MAFRYRLYPTAGQSRVMLERHCAGARFVWNLAVEQFNWGHAGRPAPDPAARQQQLAEERMVGIDRGVATTLALSGGTMLRAPDKPGAFLPNGAAAKAGLNRKIYANCWGLIAQRLDHKTSASVTLLVKVPAAYSSLECRQCGHTNTENRKSQAKFECVACGHKDHADIQPAATILARATAPTSGPEETPVPGVLAQARRPDAS